MLKRKQKTGTLNYFYDIFISIYLFIDYKYYLYVISISISLSALLGAGIMNNTFVLSVFMLVLLTQGLYFRYFAETTSILVAEFAVAMYALKTKHTVMDACIILSFYPLTLLLVYSLYFFNLG